MKTPSPPDVSLHEMLLPLLGQACTGEPCDPASLRDVDWRRFAEVCEHHQVSALLAGSLPAAVWPAEFGDHLRQRLFRTSAYNLYLAVRLAEVSRMLMREGIPSLCFKGPAVAMAAYGNLSLREFEDLDMLVRQSDILKAVEVFRRNGFDYAVDSYRPEKPTDLARYHAATLETDGSYHIDLHWQLGKDYARAFGPDPATLWARAGTLSLPAGETGALCREDLFLALCLHGTKHRWSRLKWLCDIAGLLREPERMDWAYLHRVVRERPHAAAPASLAVALVRDLLGIPVPPAAAALLSPSRRVLRTAGEIAAELRQGISKGDGEATMVALQKNPWSRVRQMARRAARFPFAKTWLQVSDKDRAFAGLPRPLRPLYLILRPARLAWQHGGRIVHSVWQQLK